MSYEIKAALHGYIIVTLLMLATIDGAEMFVNFTTFLTIVHFAVVTLIEVLKHGG